jgi:hypothetical protein
MFISLLVASISLFTKATSEMISRFQTEPNLAVHRNHIPGPYRRGVHLAGGPGDHGDEA